MSDPRVVTSAVSEVEVYRRGALVVRSATLETAELPEELVFDGLPLALDDASVRLSVDGGWALPVDVRVRLSLPPAGASLETPGDREVREAAADVERLAARLARLAREEERLQKLQPRLPDAFPNRPPRPAPAAAWLGLAQFALDRRSALGEERQTALDEHRRASEKLARLRRREAEARAAGDARAESVSKSVLARLLPVAGREKPAGSTLALRLTYAVPGARWAPRYVVRISRDGRKADLTLRAVIAQASGEAWNGVRLAVSTADLTRQTEIPELTSLRIGRRQESPPRPAWREAPEGLDELFEGLDTALASRPAPPVVPPDSSRRAMSGAGIAGPTLGRGRAAAARSAEPTPRAPGGAGDGAPPPNAAERPLSPMDITAAFAAPPPPPPPPAPAPAAQAPPAMKVRAMATSGSPGGAAPRQAERRAEKVAMAMADDTLTGEAPEGAAPEEEASAGSAGATGPGPLTLADSFKRHGELALPGWDEREHRRGRLVRRTALDGLGDLRPAERGTVERRLHDALATAEAVVSRPLPPPLIPPEESCGAYDHRWEAAGPLDVPADGRPHVLTLATSSASVRSTLVVVPRESLEAFRTASLTNPMAVPLLSGPADVYLEDELLVTASLKTVPAGGELTVGLGVEERLKVARNAFFTEEARGMLGGGASLEHRVEVELASRLAAAAAVEVRERVPVTEPGNDDVEVEGIEATPPWEEWNQAPVALVRGGRRWTLTLAPGESRKLTFRYRVKIDARNELVGGNRREA